MTRPLIVINEILVFDICKITHKGLRPVKVH